MYLEDNLYIFFIFQCSEMGEKDFLELGKNKTLEGSLRFLSMICAAIGDS